MQEENPNTTTQESPLYLTEDAVKRRFIPFLKDFYKNRYEPVRKSIEVNLDNVSEEGVVADGMLKFRNSDGEEFICTYEATSRDKAGEVKFALNQLYFIWDCAAFGAVVAAATYVFFYGNYKSKLISMHVTGNLGLLISTGLIGFLCWFLLLRNWRKYRFIHAIAQFKEYHADEQWIALAEDVFPAPTDPFMVELRNQCVYNGIGLAVVPDEGPVRKIVDPSRLGIYGKDRKMVHWVTRAQWYQTMSQNVTAMAKMRPKTPDHLTVVWNKIYRPVHYLLIDPVKKILYKPVRQSGTAYTRFMKSQAVQKMLTFVALGAITPLYWNIISYRTEESADLDQLRRGVEGPNNELTVPAYTRNADEYFVRESGLKKQDPIPVKPRFGPPDPVQNTQAQAQQVDEIDLDGGVDSEETPSTPVEHRKAKPRDKKTPCGVFDNQSGWIVQDNVFSTRSKAEERIGELSDLGVSAQKVSYSCIASGKKGYIVYLGDLYSSESAAQNAKTRFSRQLKKRNSANPNLFVRATS